MKPDFVFHHPQGNNGDQEKKKSYRKGRSRQSRPRPSGGHASRHTQHGGRAGPLGRLSASQEASSAPSMAAPQPGAAAPSGVLGPCGLEQILEALKLLLSPGGERTNLGARLHRRLAGPRVS